MDKQEAYSLVQKEIERFVCLSFEELEQHLGNNYTSEVQVTSGVRYQIDIQVFWDDNDKRNVRIIVSVDDGGWSAFSPMTDSLLVSPA